MERGYYSVKEAAEIFGLNEQRVRDDCHADGQDFAFQPVRHGKILISLKKYERYLRARRCESVRRISR